jgi:hypothetical protein
LPDFSGRLLGLFRQRLDFTSNDGEAAAMLAGSCRLDGGVERQRVGLLGHVVHLGDDLADGLRLSRQRQDVLGRRLHLRPGRIQRRDGVLDRLPARLADVEIATKQIAHGSRPFGGAGGVGGTRASRRARSSRMARARWGESHEPSSVADTASARRWRTFCQSVALIGRAGAFMIAPRKQKGVEPSRRISRPEARAVRGQPRPAGRRARRR